MRAGLLILLLVLRGALADIATPTLTRRTGSQLLESGTNYVLNFILDVSNIDTNATRWHLHVSTNSGSTYTTNGNHYTYTEYETENQPQATVKWYRAVAFNHLTGQYSTPTEWVKVWAEMQPRDLAIAVNSTNQITVTWNDVCISEAGFLMERGTNAEFSGTLVSVQLGPGTTNDTPVREYRSAVDTGFALNTTYYWRVFGTNSDGYLTEAGQTLSAAPNAAPPPVTYFSVRNAATGVSVLWTPGAGAVDRWYLQVSVGDTNAFSTIYSTTNSTANYTRYTDTGESAGTTCYYRVLGSNVVDVTYSETKAVLIPQDIASSVWYVDCDATGNGSGTNWTDAFPSFAAIAWNNIEPGALIWISDGTYNEVAYTQDTAGTSNAPITFKVSQEVGHSGKVYLWGIFSYRGWITWDGAASDSFIVNGVSSITNNINLVLGSTNVQRCIYTSVDPLQGVVFRWIECRQTQNPEWLYENQALYGEFTTAGIYIRSTAAGYHYGNEIGYLWVHDVEGDGIDVAPMYVTNWTSVNVHHSIVEHCRGNMLSGNGADYHDLILRDEVRPLGGESPPGVHPDGAQLYSSYIRFWNNVIRNTTGQALYIELNQTNTVGPLLYNNLIYSTGGVTWTNDDATLETKDINSGVVFTTEPSTFQSVMTVTNCIIANNTLYGFLSTYLAITRRVAECTTLSPQNWVVANNLLFNMSSTEQDILAVRTDGSPVATDTNAFTVSDVVFVSNDLCGTNATVTYAGTSYSADGINGLGFTNNFSYAPAFVRSGYRQGTSYGYDFHLTDMDRTNMAGVDLSGYEAEAPGISRNADRTSRASTGWPVGALSSDWGTNLVLWFSFNEAFGSDVGYVTDSSPFLNHGRMYSATNWPGSTNGHEGSAAQFVKDWTYTDGGFFGIGQYIAITNMALVNGLTSATFAVWAKYDSAGGNYANAQTARILDGGVNDLGNWIFGRASSPNTRFLVYTNDDEVNATLLLTFPDTTTTGNTTNWHHYAVTFDGSQVIGYYDGSAFATNSTFGVSELTVGGVGDGQYLGVSCWPHGGTPDWGDDDYPNAGWFHGALDDIRIYNRSLSASEVQAVYSGSQGSENEPAAPSPFRTLGKATLGKGTW